MGEKIPIYQPFINLEEKKNVEKCLTTSWISSRGEFIQKFENKVKTFTGASYASCVANGSVALHLALLAAGVGMGDEVITTNFTYVASTNAILMVGAKPIFVEINSETWNIDVSKIQNKITNKTKAILVTNIYGFPCDFDSLNSLCSKNKILLIEDAAESFGAEFNNQKSGCLADISTFSFFGNKTITTGEGGMVLCKSKEHFEVIEQLKNQGNSKTKKYFHDVQGYNYRMTNIQAAIGCAQMEKIDQILTLKKNVDSIYRNELEELVTFQKIKDRIKPSFWMSSIVFDNKRTMEKVNRELNYNNIETRPLFFPIDKLPFYDEDKSCSLALQLHDKGLSLPSFPGLKENQILFITSIIKKNV